MDAYLIFAFDQLYYEQPHQANSRKFFPAPNENIF